LLLLFLLKYRVLNIDFVFPFDSGYASNDGAELYFDNTNILAMSTYRLRLVSFRNTCIIVILYLLLLVILELLLFPKIKNELLYGLVIMAFLGAFYFIWEKLVIGITEWTIDTNGVKMHWLKQFGFDKQDDFSAEWKYIGNFTSKDRREVFSIKLSDGRSIKFSHDTQTRKDDYKAFKNDFRQAISQINN